MCFSKPIRVLVLVAGFLVFLPVNGASSAGTVPGRSPFWSGTIRGPGVDGVVAMKGIAIPLGTNRNAYVCYDTDLVRMALAWSGGFLEFGNTLTRIEWPPPPAVKGVPAFGSMPWPGWSPGKEFADSRRNGQGPLPRQQARFRGLHVNGDQVVVASTAVDCEILELPGIEPTDHGPIFTRTIRMGRSATPLNLLIAGELSSSPTNRLAAPASTQMLVLGDSSVTNGPVIATALRAGPKGATWESLGGVLRLKLPPLPDGALFQLAIWSGERGNVPKIDALLTRGIQGPDPGTLCRGGTPHFPEIVETTGVRSTGSGAYVVDTLTEPLTNPWGVKTFFGGFDFLPDGRAAICTFHGDVWLVSGIDDSLAKLRWKRFAAGLFQPLGLKVVDGRIHVLGRDQITRLHDLNDDGEADYYENFNNDGIVTANYHEFCLDLDTDSQGNFYYAKGAPWEPEVTTPHQGCLLRVSSDGSRLEVVATGFRAPNGLAIGPRDEITVSDNQGHWMPASKLNLIKPGGFYGMTPTAQRELTLARNGTNFVANPSDPQARARFEFKSWDTDAPMPTGHDEPLCWLPMGADNSSGGQVWVTSDRWGPFQNQLLFTSYGKCTLFHVMQEVVEGVAQAGMVQFPLKFNSGVMRGRVNPRDGQVYLCGLKGWQTSGARDGGFYRVRYTGQPVRMASAIHFLKNGIRLTFTCLLNPKSAGDVQNYSAEEWNYRWSGKYGSPDYSVRNPDRTGRDVLEFKSAKVLDDQKSVFLEIPNLRPADQVRVKLMIEAADGELIVNEIFGTAHRLGQER